MDFKRLDWNCNLKSAIFLDIGKAFDRLWHDGLIYEVHHCGTPAHLTKIVRSLQDRSFHIKIDGHLYWLRMISAGLPQGSSLSPLLYVTYITVSFFADDTMYYSSNNNINYTAAQLQRRMDLTTTLALTLEAET